MLRKMLLGVMVAALTVIIGQAARAEVEVGAAGPDFKAKGVDGKDYSLDSSKGAKATVLCFTCNNCPVAVAYEDRFIEFAKKYGEKGVKFVAVNCNTTEDLDAMKQRAEEKGFTFPYIYDESGAAARGYGARVTPHLFVLDSNGKVAYRGAFDDSQSNPSKKYVEDAVNAVLSGKSPAVSSTKAFGCGIKLK
ncbi:MAG: thioredoxin family protein [Pirellulaceae bacterium]|nr:thioredoxin family protein [Pirellulaceae bacterium]